MSARHLSIEALRIRRPTEADDIEAATKILPPGSEIQVFRHVYEDCRRSCGGKNGDDLYFGRHKIICGPTRRKRAIKRPQEAFQF